MMKIEVFDLNFQHLSITQIHLFHPVQKLSKLRGDREELDIYYKIGLFCYSKKNFVLLFQKVHIHNQVNLFNLG